MTTRAFSRHKADFQITLLVRTIRMEGGKLTALTSNSLPSYAARLCKDAMLTGEGGEIERALEHLEGMHTEVQAAHDRIYSAAGICKEWTDMQETVNRFDGAIKVLQDILCHILEGDLREAWQDAHLRLPEFTVATKGMSEIAELLGLAKVKLIKRWLTPYRDARDGKGPVSVETLLEQLFLQFVDHYPFESTLEDAEKHYPQERLLRSASRDAELRRMLYQTLDWLDSVPVATSPASEESTERFSSPLPSSSPPLPSSPLPMTPPGPVRSSWSRVRDNLGDVPNPLCEWIESMYEELESQPESGREDGCVAGVLTDWQGYEMGP
ncbi:hypothetical protein EDD18DRAFT_1117082 [Armillaria luteobubalina]|uniref:Uncharacterized protein n=1 Tax=Armillaria luteobubalina TaxID=153913 RepID=A0AA39UCP2_9AGAR|nr:hypothetical protein EDD18DRAFT_1117082 [Armillaria luteobubalina]